MTKNDKPLTSINPTKLAIAIIGMIALLAAGSLTLPRPQPTSQQVSAFQEALDARIYRALLLHPDRSEIASRFGKSIEELATIESKGDRAGWKLADDPESAERAQHLKNLVGVGFLIRIDYGTQEAFVDASEWRRANVDEKRSVMYLFNQQMRAVGTDGVQIIDYQSGQRLARVSRGGGYEYY